MYRRGRTTLMVESLTPRHAALSRFYNCRRSKTDTSSAGVDLDILPLSSNYYKSFNESARRECFRGRPPA